MYGAEWSDYRKCSGHSRRSGKQRRGFTVTRAHHQPESHLGTGRDFRDHHRNGLRNQSRIKHCFIQWDNGRADKLERDEHRCTSAGRRDDR